MTDDAPSAPMIVVATDCSEMGERALQWAVDLASKAHLRVHVVLAWHLPAGDWAPEPEADEKAESYSDRLAKVATKLLAESIDRVSAHHEGVSITSEHVKGMPVDVVLRVVKEQNASLLVMGRSHQGWLAKKVSGSLSEYFAANADCPVAVVR